jgi:hypothetical protein
VAGSTRSRLNYPASWIEERKKKKEKEQAEIIAQRAELDARAMAAFHSAKLTRGISGFSIYLRQQRVQRALSTASSYKSARRRDNLPSIPVVKA